jgi:hypothetical protein
MVPPQTVPGPKPVQAPFYGNNNGMPQQNTNTQQNSNFFQTPQQRPQQQQNFNRGTQPQQNFSGYNNQSNFVPQQPKPPVQKQTQFQSQNQFETDQFDDSQTFEPQPQTPSISGFGDSRQSNQQNNYFDYGSINLEPMANSSSHQTHEEEAEVLLEQNSQSQGFIPPQESGNVEYSQNQFDPSGKTDLDLEIEKYQREIEEKQKKIRVQPAPLTQQPNQKQMPNQIQQPLNSAKQQQPLQGAQLSSNTAENDYDVYNMELPSFPPQNQPPTQRQSAVGVDEGDETMFFTSVDTDRQKRPIKKPVVNPRTAKDQPQQQKGFLSKFFNRDTP